VPKPITDDLIKRTTCPDGKADVLIFDSHQQGYFLKVTQTGRKVLGCQYMIDGRNRRVQFGDVGALYAGYLLSDEQRRDGYWLRGRKREPLTLTADFGRILAARVRANRLSDPYLQQQAWYAEQKDHAATAVDTGPGLDQVFAQYLQDRTLKPLTRKQYVRLYVRHLQPVLGAVPINDWDRQTARLLRAHAEAGVGTRRKGAAARAHWPNKAVRKTTANRVQVLAAGLCNFAISERYRDDAKGNPFTGKPWHEEIQRERHFTTAQVAAVLRACDALDDGRPAFDVIRLLAFTGLRKNEALSLRWDAIHWTAFTTQDGRDVACVVLAESKTGRSVRPLSPQAVDLLRAVPRRDDTYVFPGRYPGTPLTDVHKAWKAVCTEAGVDGGLHSLRHAFGHGAAVLGAGALTIGKALGHKRRTTAERYADPGLAAAHLVAVQVSEAVEAALLQSVDITPSHRARVRR
jgi:integrase